MSKKNKHEIPKNPNTTRGQYPSDFYVNGEEPFDPDGALTRGQGDMGFHQVGMYDEEVFTVPNEATGKVSRAPNELTDNGLSVGEFGEAIVDLATAGDESDEWLKENDPNYGHADYR